MSVICISNNKGGAGKSTLTMNLGGALAEKGQDTLLIDLDPQSNLTSIFLDNTQSISLTISDLIFNNTDAIDVVRETKMANLSILPANSDLQSIDSRLAGDDDAQFFLLEELEPIKEKYQYILIDCPPNLGKATRMALVASDYVIIPIQCQDWAVRGCQQVITYIQRVKRRANPKLKLLGILINRLNTRRRVEIIYKQILRQTYENLMFQTEIRDNVPYVEAITAKSPITSYQPTSPQAEVYRILVEEVINRAKK